MSRRFPSPLETLIAQAEHAEARAAEETKIADECRAESLRRLEAAGDYMHHAAELRAAVGRLEVQR